MILFTLQKLITLNDIYIIDYMRNTSNKSLSLLKNYRCPDKIPLQVSHMLQTHPYQSLLYFNDLLMLLNLSSIAYIIKIRNKKMSIINWAFAYECAALMFFPAESHWSTSGQFNCFSLLWNI